MVTSDRDKERAVREFKLVDFCKVMRVFSKDYPSTFTWKMVGDKELIEVKS